MQKRIEIDWDDSVKLGDESIIGTVKVFQGESVIEVREVGQCQIEVSAYSHRLYPAPSKEYLPKEIVDEKTKELIYSLSTAYLRGLNCKTHLYHWMEVD